jgi:hypothetical protein
MIAFYAGLFLGVLLGVLLTHLLTHFLPSKNDGLLPPEGNGFTQEKPQES